MGDPTAAAVAYLRISDDREGLGLGIERQRRDVVALAERQGLDLVEVVTDNDRSAYSGRARPGWDRVVELVESRQVGAIATWATDRLTRHPRELEDLVDLLDRAGCRVVTCTSGDYDLTNPEGRAVARIVGAIARQESERKSVRSSRKHLELAEGGRLAGGGTRPFGFEPDFVTIRPAEADLIRQAADLVVAGESLRSVSRWLSERTPTPTGRDRWAPSVVSRMLQSGRVAGLREHRGEIVADAEWPAIVDRGTWEQVRAVLSDPARRKYGPGGGRRYLLTGGIATCGKCMAPLVARPVSGGRPCYQCVTDQPGAGVVGCGRTKVDAVGLEQLVEAQLIEAFDSPEFRHMLATEADAAAHRGPDVGERIADLEAQLTQLATDHYADRLIGRAEYLAARRSIDGHLTELRRSLRPTVDIAIPDDFGSWWPQAPFEDRKAIAAAAIERVFVGPAVPGRNRFDPDRVKVAWR